MLLLGLTTLRLAAARRSSTGTPATRTGLDGRRGTPAQGSLCQRHIAAQAHDLESAGRAARPRSGKQQRSQDYRVWYPSGTLPPTWLLSQLAKNHDFAGLS
jgi:hypothetical protein